MHITYIQVHNRRLDTRLDADEPKIADWWYEHKVSLHEEAAVCGGLLETGTLVI